MITLKELVQQLNDHIIANPEDASKPVTADAQSEGDGWVYDISVPDGSVASWEGEDG